MTVRVIAGNALACLRELPAESVHCAVTSPPYYGLRDYGCAGQIGLEPSPEAYAAALVEVFREVRRVLRADGTCWLNLGDSYGSRPDGSHGGWDGSNKKADGSRRTNSYARSFRSGNPDKNGGNSNRDGVRAGAGCKSKDLLGIPWMVAFALRADGWYLRSEIIWHKPNPMPESVTDRPTCAHEKLFLLAKSARYFYDAEAIKEPAQSDHPAGNVNGFIGRQGGASFHVKSGGAGNPVAWSDLGGKRNKRNVWTITSAPYRGAHFATFPPKLVEPCILAGTSERGVCRKCGAPWVRVVQDHRDTRKPYATIGTGAKAKLSRNDGNGLQKVLREDGRGGDLATTQKETVGWRPTCYCNAGAVPATVLDPFAGAGTTGLVAERLGRDALLIELNPSYADMARTRIASDGQAAA